MAKLKVEGNEIKYPGGEVYKGEIKKGKPHGNGELVFADGVVQKGYFIKGKPENMHEYFYPNGDKMHANFMEGKAITMNFYFKNGDHLSAELKGGKVAKHCWLTFFNGEKMALDLKGSYEIKDFAYAVRGDMRDEKLNADVLYTFNNGAKMDGCIKNGRLNGKFDIHFRTKDFAYYFAGFVTLKNNELVGKSKLDVLTFKVFDEVLDFGLHHESWGTIQNDEVLYIGGLKDNLPHGFGMAKFRQTDHGFVGLFEKGYSAFGMDYSSKRETLLARYKDGLPHGWAIVATPYSPILRVCYEDGVLTGQSEIYTKYHSTEKGEYKDGRLNGYGMTRSSNGALYVGQAKDNVPNGCGTVIFADDTVYTGKFKNGVREGTGKEIKPNGDIYEGVFKDDEYCGKGKITQKDGTIMQGIFDNKTKSFQGVLTYTNGTTVQTKLVDGKPEGESVVTKDGNKSIHQEGKKDRVVVKLPNGGEYDGEVENGVPNGAGILSMPGVVISGYFINGKMQGKGCMSYYKDIVFTYEGDFVDNVPNGVGKFTFSDDSVYEGEVKDSKPNGKGKMVSSKGNTYVGTYVNGKREGLFEAWFKNGDYFKGEYKNDEPNGKGEYTMANGKKQKGIWKNGKFVR